MNIQAHALFDLRSHARLKIYFYTINVYKLAFFEDFEHCFIYSSSYVTLQPQSSDLYNACNYLW